MDQDQGGEQRPLPVRSWSDERTVDSREASFSELSILLEQRLYIGINLYQRFFFVFVHRASSMRLSTCVFGGECWVSSRDYRYDNESYGWSQVRES